MLDIESISVQTKRLHMSLQLDTVPVLFHIHKTLFVIRISASI